MSERLSVSDERAPRTEQTQQKSCSWETYAPLAVIPYLIQRLFGPVFKSGPLRSVAPQITAAAACRSSTAASSSRLLLRHHHWCTSASPTSPPARAPVAHAASYEKIEPPCCPRRPTRFCLFLSHRAAPTLSQPPPRYAAKASHEAHWRVLGALVRTRCFHCPPRCACSLTPRRSYTTIDDPFDKTKSTSKARRSSKNYSAALHDA